MRIGPLYLEAYYVEPRYCTTTWYHNIYPLLCVEFCRIENRYRTVEIHQWLIVLLVTEKSTVSTYSLSTGIASRRRISIWVLNCQPRTAPELNLLHRCIPFKFEHNNFKLITTILRISTSIHSHRSAGSDNHNAESLSLSSIVPIAPQGIKTILQPFTQRGSAFFSIASNRNWRWSRLGKTLANQGDRNGGGEHKETKATRRSPWLVEKLRTS